MTDTQENRSVVAELNDVRYTPQASRFKLSVGHLQIRQSETLAVTGPSGSGKTTLLSLLSGRIVPCSGQIELFGKNLATFSDRARERFRRENIGIVFQDFRLIEYLTVSQNIALKDYLASGSGSSDRGRQVSKIAEALQISHLLARLPQKLSQGERQRVAIGRAIFGQPRLILADEPTGNLDSETAAETLEFLFRSVQSAQATLVMVTHDRSILSQFERHVDLRELQQSMQQS